MRHVLSILLLIILGCTHKPSSSEKPKLNLSSSFAFIYADHEYAFAASDCRTMVGKRDAQEEYEFPTSKMTELNRIYESNRDINEKISEVAKKLEEWKGLPSQRDCDPEHSSSEKALTMAVYSPLILVTLPFWGAVVASDLMDPVPEKLEKLKLNMDLADVQVLLGRQNLYSRKDGKTLLYIFDHKKERMVMLFQSNKLKAWVRGLNPDLWK